MAAKIKPSTLKEYRRAALSFSTWLLTHGLSPVTAEHWDDLLVAYKNMEKVSKGHFTMLVAAVEFFFPLYQVSCAL